MNKKELLGLIEEGESSTIEFKRKISSYEKIAKEISAFANTKGGYLLIGIDDDGSVKGVESEKNDIDQILIACGFFLIPPVVPSIDIINLSGKDIIVCYIAESVNKPHFIKEDPDNDKSAVKAYIRNGDESVIASKEMTRILSGLKADSKPLKLAIGEKEKRLFSYLDKNGKATVDDFARIVNISHRRAERLMVRLVRAGVLQIHIDTAHDYFTLVEKI